MKEGGENSYVHFFMLTDITTLSKTPVLSNASSSTFSSTTVVKRNSDVAETSMSISVDVEQDPRGWVHCQISFNHLKLNWKITDVNTLWYKKYEQRFYFQKPSGGDWSIPELWVKRDSEGKNLKY